MIKKENPIFQKHMPENVCFGCGQNNHEGLQIHSHWDGEVAICRWKPEEKYNGWKGLLNGGILATLVDCHCMCTAMAEGYRLEDRSLDSLPEYRYATGTMTLKYLQPTPIDEWVELRATVTEVKGRKTVLHCEVFSKDIKTVDAQVIAIRVFDSSVDDGKNLFG